MATPKLEIFQQNLRKLPKLQNWFRNLYFSKSNHNRVTWKRWVEQGQGKYILFSSSLSCCFAFQLAYSYIQCTNVSWSASSYDADTGNKDQHPVHRWSHLTTQSQWWDSSHFRGSFLCVPIFLFHNVIGYVPILIKVFLEAS